MGTLTLTAALSWCHHTLLGSCEKNEVQTCKSNLNDWQQVVIQLKRKSTAASRDAMNYELRDGSSYRDWNNMIVPAAAERIKAKRECNVGIISAEFTHILHCVHEKSK